MKSNDLKLQACLDELEKQIKDRFSELDDSRKLLIANSANIFASALNRYDLSGLESEIAAYLSFSSVRQSNTAFEKAGYGALNELPIRSMLQKVLLAMNEEELVDMEKAIASTGEGAVNEAFKFLTALIRRKRNKEVDKSVKAG